MIDNNFTESFNSWIVEAKQKPIIKMLEEIRVKVMNILRKHEAEVKSWKNEFSPHAMHLFHDYKVYKHKIEPVRGEKFWKIELHHAMEPPILAKMAGRPNRREQERRMRLRIGRGLGQLLEKEC
uniref:Uncharacterized protein n=1 Tax=Solanum lycopersicum TaxID=4081 RepID=A0A3Q7GLF0_SOLLC